MLTLGRVETPRFTSHWAPLVLATMLLAPTTLRPHHRPLRGRAWESLRPLLIRINVQLLLGWLHLLVKVYVGCPRGYAASAVQAVHLVLDDISTVALAIDDNYIGNSKYYESGGIGSRLRLHWHIRCYNSIAMLALAVSI